MTTQILDEVEEIEEPVVKPRSPALDDELDITPMIDIVFLLLIFFLVSSKMNAEQAGDLPKARHGTVIAAKESVVLLMRRGTGEQADVLKANGDPFSKDLDQQAAEIAAYVAEGLSSGKQHVIIRADTNVRHGEIGRVNAAISESLEDGAMINIAVMEQN